MIPSGQKICCNMQSIKTAIQNIMAHSRKNTLETGSKMWPSMSCCNEHWACFWHCFGFGNRTLLPLPYYRAPYIELSGEPTVPINDLTDLIFTRLPIQSPGPGFSKLFTSRAGLHINIVFFITVAYFWLWKCNLFNCLIDYFSSNR